MLIVAAMVAVGVLHAPAMSQDDDADEPPMWTPDGGYSRYRPNISRSEVTFFARTAGLTPDQREAALELWASYSERHMAASEKMEEYAESLTGGDQAKEWQDTKVREQLQPVREDFAKFEKRIDKELTDDLRSVLTDPQEANWKWFERRLEVNRRGYSVSLQGGERVDLALIAHRSSGSAAWSDELFAALDKYYAEMLELMEDAEEDQKAAITERVERRKQVADENAGVDQDEERDEYEKRANVFRLRGAQLNERYATKVAGLLPSEVTERFEERFLRAMAEGFSFAMADSGRVFDLALRAEGLSGEQRERLASMRSEWSKEERGRLRKALDARLEKLESGDDQRDAMAFSTGYQARLARQSATLKEVRGVLTPEQAEAAGPPLSISMVSVPDFEAEDEPEPAPKAKRNRSHGMEQFFEMRSLRDGDIAFFMRVAELDDDQRESAKDLLASYTSRQRRAVRKMSAYQEAMTERAMQGDTGDSTNKKAMQVYLKFGEYSERIMEEALSDLRAILTDEQAAAYDRLERRVRRRSVLNAQLGMMSAGAGLDLVGLLEGVAGKEGIPEETDVILARYEAEIAPAVDRLRALEKEQQGKWGKMAEAEGEIDMAAQMAAGQEMMMQMQKLSSGARDLNVKFFREAVATLPERVRPEAEQAFYFAASPFGMMGMMGGDESGGRTPRGLMDEAVALGDLTDEQRASLGDAVFAQAKEAAAKYREVFDKLVEAEKEHPNAMERMQSMGELNVYGVEQEVREQGDKAVESMLAVLTVEQRERLPRPYRPPGSVARPRFEED